MLNQLPVEYKLENKEKEEYQVMRGSGVRKFGQLYRVYELMDTTHNLTEKRHYELFLLNLRKPLGFKPYFSFKGGYTKNTFRVDRPILLSSIGFFGPFYEISAEYQIKIQIEIENFRHKNQEIGFITKKVDVPREEIFYIDFKSPIRIEEGQWHNILFQLDGPPTCVMDRNYITSYFPEKKVDFDFFYGSKQMPILKFKLA